MRTGVAMLLIVLASPRVGAELALWVPVGVAPEDELGLRAALEASGGREIIDLAETRRRLIELAGRAGPDGSGEETSAALREAREAYVELRLDAAGQAYDRAAESAMGSDRRTADPRELARIAFERGLVELAAQRRPEARRELLTAVLLDPQLAPDPDVYGPPVFRALDEARSGLGRGPAMRVRIDRAPEDATVRLDGAIVAPGEVTRVRGAVPHLVTTERLGFVPQSTWLEPAARGESRAAVLLARAEGPLLAAQAMTAWGEGRSLEGEIGVVVARAVGASSVIDASRGPEGEIHLALRDATTGAGLRSARGRRVDWEVRPFHVLAEALEGRLVEPPPPPVPAPEEVVLTVALPTDVPPSASFPVEVTLRDLAGRVRRLDARCGASRDQRPAGPGVMTLLLRSPTRPGPVACQVRAVDGSGGLVVDRRLTLAVVQPVTPTRWYERWGIWGIVGVALAAGVTAGILASQDEPPADRIMVIDAPE